MLVQFKLKKKKILTKGLDVVILTVAGTSMVVVLVAVRVISLFANKHD